MKLAVLKTSVVALLVLGNLQVAEAASVYGRWRSSSGNVFEISTVRGRFHIRAHLTDGQTKYLSGHWVPGMRGAQFVYRDGPTQFTGTFSPRDPDRVRVVGGARTTWWRRAGMAPAAGGKARIFGVWRSTSGNYFQVPEAMNRRRFDLIVTRPNGSREVLAGRWVRGMRGMQFEYSDANGVRYTGTFSPRNPNRIRNTNSRGGVSWWSRHFGAVPMARQRPHYGRQPYARPAVAPGPRAMDARSFSDLMHRVRRKSFSRDKVDMVRLAAKHNWFTCAQVSQMVRSMSFSRDKVSSLRAMAPRIVDRKNSYTILDALTFSSDKRKARKILGL